MEAHGSSVSYAMPQRTSLRWPVAHRSVWGLCLLFLLSLPFANPYVHGDGVGYYAYARALLVQGDLRFEEDWRRANEGFSQARMETDGTVQADQYTETGHVNNVFTIGPAILWSPFLVPTHLAVLVVREAGGAVPADGFSWPYRMAMALGTACLGFLSLLLSFDLVRKYVEERWAVLATLGVWTATSLPVYMYFNPSWSHAHSAFVVALFIWFWERTRPGRTLGQWVVLGLVGGLMLNTYFPNGIFLLMPLIEALRGYFQSFRRIDLSAVGHQLGQHGIFALILILAVVPTLVTRAIVFGGPFRFGAYGSLPWDWSAPHWREVLFSSNHGLLSWTPLIALAIVGLLWANDQAREITALCGAAALGFYYVISSYPYWDGTSSFGNRFFISLTPVFILGLSLLFQRVGRLFPPRSGFIALAGLVGLLALWNGGFIFQWGTQMIPARGPISWKQMAHNQIAVVPARIANELEHYILRRDSMMQRIEVQDLERRRQQGLPVSEP
jgi:hypothetical protein